MKVIERSMHCSVRGKAAEGLLSLSVPLQRISGQSTNKPADTLFSGLQ
jgi:hypothetical protein